MLFGKLFRFFRNRMGKNNFKGLLKTYPPQDFRQTLVFTPPEWSSNKVLIVALSTCKRNQNLWFLISPLLLRSYAIGNKICVNFKKVCFELRVGIMCLYPSTLENNTGGIALAREKCLTLVKWEHAHTCFSSLLKYLAYLARHWEMWKCDFSPYILLCDLQVANIHSSLKLMQYIIILRRSLYLFIFCRIRRGLLPTLVSYKRRLPATLGLLSGIMPCLTVSYLTLFHLLNSFSYTLCSQCFPVFPSVFVKVDVSEV